MSISTTTDLSNLWNPEAMGISDPIERESKEDFEKEALDYFNDTVEQDEIGRYVVALPWKRDSLDLPSNRVVAEKRLRRETQKLKKMGKWDVYDKVMKDWREEGLTAIVEDNDEGHYLPHRPVFKNSSSTPVRPVFDASCRTVNKLSLNDYLHKGPNYLELIPTLLLKLRENKVGVTADIRKAFQMLRVRDEDKKFQKFLWWEDESCTKMIVYQHERVVFGMVCSPFLLAATIMHHLNKNNLEAVTVSRLKTSYYVDNCVTSVTSMEEFWNYKDEASVVMREAGMELRQWAYAPFKIEACNDDDPTLEKDPCLMVLGLCWNREADQLSCEVKDAVIAGDITKRVVLSVVSKIFDPLGILCPTTLQMKQILQEAWGNDFGWDDPLPETTCKKVRAWMEESRLLRKMSIPRHFQCEFPVEREVHCFADASGISFACVLFMRTKSSSGLVSVKFLIAKSRFAPLKKNTIPRLELMACLLGVRMWQLVCSSIDMAGVRTRFWTDSTTALSWIQRNEEYGVFVNNRVTEIRTLTKIDQWAHIPGVHNPADLPSRGCTPSQLMTNLEWIEGPAWLKLEPDIWPSSTEKADEEEIRREFKKIASCSSLIPEDDKPRFGSYERLVRVWVYVSRFLNIRNGKSDRKGGITIMEMRQAEKLMLKQVQQACFPEKSTVIGGIHVKVDGDGLLLVVTKLDYREDSDDFISPILMPKRHPYTDLLIMRFHRMHKHVAPQTLMASLRQKYWIIQTRRTVRRVLRKCVVCRRYNAKSLEVPVAPLPEKRVMDAEPFQTTGVDLAGPLFLRDGTKTWIVLFTCAVYRCVYLELVTSCSTEAFLGALERFVGIYGRPNTIYSDNGLNFVGSDNLFRQLDWESIERESQVKRINWSFNPPTAAWWGGFWERLIRDVKNLLKRNIGRSRLDIDQLRTLLFGIASIINDRPLTVMTEDDSDMVPLTPAMFIRARAIGHLPETETAEGLSASYRHMKKIQAQLQNRFRKEYLSMLVQRGNERKEKDLAVGDVVLVGADNKKRFEWPLGRVEKLVPGTDGKIRVAVVKTASGVFTRPLQRLYPLEVTRTEAFPKPAATERKTEKASHEQVLGKTKSGRLVIRPSRYGSCVSFSL